MRIKVEIEGEVIPEIQGVGVDDFQDGGDETDYDGLVGLTPVSFDESTDLFVDWLFSNDLIPLKMFSINYELANA